MNANIPKSYHSLPKSQQDKLKEYAKQIAFTAAEEQLNKDLRIMLDIYIKMVCMVLHDSFDFDEDDLMMFLGNHRRPFAKQRKLAMKDEQLKYLNGRMAEIFKENGFPQKFFDDMLGEVDCE